MAEEHTVSVADAFRIAGRPRGVDEYRVLGGVGGDGFDGLLRCVTTIAVTVVAAAVRVAVAAVVALVVARADRRLEAGLPPARRGIDGHDGIERRKGSSYAPQGVDVRVVDDAGDRLAVGQAIGERVGAEQGAQGHGDRAELPGREMRDHGFRFLGNVHPDPVVPGDTLGDEVVGQPVRGGA